MLVASNMFPKLVRLSLLALILSSLAPLSYAWSFSPSRLLALLRRGQQQQRIPGQSAPKTSALQGVIRDANGNPVGGARIALRNLATADVRQTTSTAQGVFRLLDVPPGKYEVDVSCDGYENFSEAGVSLAVGEVIVRDFALTPLPPVTPAPSPGLPQIPQSVPSATGTAPPPGAASAYPEVKPSPDL